MIDPTKVDVKVEESEQQYNVSASDTNIPVRVDVAEDSTQENVSVSDENIPMKMETETEIVSGIVDTYEGPYEVTPSSEEQTLLTKGLNMEENVVIDPVPPTPVPANQIHRGTTQEWNEQPELIGELEHIYVYTDYSSINGVSYPGIKIGDGETLLADLPFATGSNTFPLIDLGEFDMEEYDWDFWSYLNDKTESGFYHLYEVQDGFDYFFRVERAGSSCYQEWWYAEEGSMMRMCRNGWQIEENVFEWGDPTEWLTSETAYNTFAAKWQTYTKQEVDSRLSGKVDNSTLDDYYTSEEVDDLLSGFAPETMIETTWAALRELRDNSQLVKGAWYRITDYNFVTTKLGMQSGNHPFDIVLLAISKSMLSESGYACKHAGDHYFEREVTEGGIEWLYTIYVDDYAESYGDEPVDHVDDIHSTDVFCNHTYDISPVTGDEVPVLFKTDGEEYSIDEPDYDDRFYYEGTYDLDGDEYDMWGKYEYDQDNEKWVFLQQYALTPIVVEDGELIVSPIPETKIVPVNMNAWELKYCLDNDKKLFDWAETDGKGVIYYLKDEFGNEAPYDFKNVLFRRKNITRVSSNDLSIFTQGENSHLGLLSNYGITCGDNNYYYYTFDTPFNAGNDSSLFGDSAYNTIKPYILEGQRLINNIVLGIANNNTIGSNCYDLTLWGTVGENNLTYNCSNLLVVGLSQTIMTYVRSTTFFSLGSTTFGSGCFDNIGSMLTNSEIGDGCNNNNFGTGNIGIKMGNGCTNNTFGTFNYNNTFKSGVANCNLGNYVSYCEFGIAAVDITLPNYVRYCKFEPDIHKIKFTTSGGSTSRYIQYVTVCRGISNLTVAPPRNTAYEQIYYKTGRIETAV